MDTPTLISADSHFVEPPEMWSERIDARYRDRAPHTIKGWDGQGGEWFVCENVTPMNVASFFGAGIPADELQEHNEKGFEAAPPSVRDARYRIEDQDRDGISAEVIYTSMGMPLFGLEDGGLRAACFRAFNDWATDYCSYDRKRLVPLGLITMEDVSEAVEELRRIARMGMGGAMIWAEPPDDKPYHHPDYERFWASAQDLDMPLSLHILTGRSGAGTGRGTGQDFLLGIATLHHQIERSLVTLVLGGVLEKFPRLRIVSAENDVAWMPYLMYRLDAVQKRIGKPNGLMLPERASDYIRRQVFATFIADPVFPDSLHRFGADNIMWSSDYPHTAATFPRSREIVEKRFGHLPEEQFLKIVHHTAARVYGLE